MYFFNRHQDYDYDVEEFNSHLAQARISERIDDKIAQLRAAVKLWHGSYLQGLDVGWAWPERQPPRAGVPRSLAPACRTPAPGRGPGFRLAGLPPRPRGGPHPRRFPSPRHAPAMPSAAISWASSGSTSPAAPPCSPSWTSFLPRRPRRCTSASPPEIKSRGLSLFRGIYGRQYLSCAGEPHRGSVFSNNWTVFWSHL